MKYIRFAIFLFLMISHSSVRAQESLPPAENQKTVLLTGAAGFIGSNFLTYMFEKYPSYHFIVIDALTYAGSLDKIPEKIRNSSRFEFIHDTITNEKVVDYAISKSHFVVHFAAETHVTRSIQDDALFFYTDVMGTRMLMSKVVKYVKNIERFIHISTSEVYGTAEYTPMDENHPLNPCSPYAAAKVGADRLVYSYFRTFNVPAMIIRPFNNYGPAQHVEKLIPRLITAAIKGEPLTIHGTGDQKRDWIHTHDTARAIDAALHTSHFNAIKHQVINVGSGIATSVLEVAKTILEEFGLPESQLQFISDRPGQVDIHLSSTEKAEKLLNWKAEKSVSEGIRETIEWYKNNESIWKEMEKDALVPITTPDGEIILH